MRKVLRKNQYCMAPIKPCLNLGVHLGDVVRNPLHINLAWL